MGVSPNIGWRIERDAIELQCIVSRSMHRLDDGIRPCWKEKMIPRKMILKRMYTRSISTRFCLLVAVVGILVLLAACGGGSTPGTSSVTTPTTIANTPTTAAGNTTPTLAPTIVQPTPTPTTVQPTPTPTTVQPTPARSSTQVVMIITNSDGSYSFSPAKLTIKVGTTVIWRDVSSAPHTVTSDDGTTFDSGTVSVGSSFRFTFKTAGSFSYHCNIHPYMKATVVVA